jgi:hypothetical protein
MTGSWKTSSDSKPTRKSSAAIFYGDSVKSGDWYPLVGNMHVCGPATGPTALESCLLRSQQEILAQLTVVRDQIDSHIESSQPYPYTLMSLAPVEGYVLNHPIQLVVECVQEEDQSDDYFLVTFVEASVGACGETLSDAVHELKHLIAAKLDTLLSLKESGRKFGKLPERQLQVLDEALSKV